MQRFTCAVCSAPLFFENSRCLACGAQLGFHRGERVIAPLDDDGVYRDREGQESPDPRVQRILGRLVEPLAGSQGSGELLPHMLRQVGPGDRQAQLLNGQFGLSRTDPGGAATPEVQPLVDRKGRFGRAETA